MTDSVPALLARGRTGTQAGVISCEVCENLCPAGEDASHQCARCGASLHLRDKNSLSKTVAYLIAAYILYIPANLLPVMHTETIFGPEDDTIMSGVVVLLSTGSWPLAALVFFASIVVPLLKLFSLTVLCYTSWRKSRWHPLSRTRLYRVVEAVGRWSMLDIYVVTVLVALVQFQTLASVYPGGGAFAFGSVVVLTMLSALHFDSRLIWDTSDTDYE